jgi:TatD DNase family protein
MIIDTHCHIDLFENPKMVLKLCEQKGISVISMTNLPSHFEMGYFYFQSLKKIRLALGMHPLMADSHKQEFDLFLKNINRTSYIGEVGLDFSKEGIYTKDIQIDTFSKILKVVSGQKKILSIHSRKAEKEVLDLLIKNNIKSAIFHWYSGSVSLLYKILDAGYYFSINPAMANSNNGQTIISKIPMNKILTESDGPFTQFNNNIVHPWDLKIVLDYISITRQIDVKEVENQVQSNFIQLIDKIR